jgi:hypothetical protein
MTANVFDEDRQGGLDAGMDDDIGKRVEALLPYSTLEYCLSQASRD